MKINYVNPLTLLLTCSLSFSVAAEEMEGSRFSGGIKLGMYLVDSGVSNSFESSTGMNVDIDNGIGFGLHGDYLIKENWYIDVEYLTGSLDSKVSTTTGSTSSDIDISSFAAYAAYRSPEQLYYIGKLGLIYEDIGVGSYSKSEVGVGFAVGAGYQIKDNFTLEAEFTCIDQDIAFVGFTGRYKIQ